jgi:hypothetical protein
MTALPTSHSRTDPVSQSDNERIADAKPPALTTAVPPVGARVLAFVSILVGGACGALIGYSVTDLQCAGTCTTPKGLGLLTGAVVGALGVAVVSVLVLRAMGEWRTIQGQARSDSRRNPSA